MGEFDIVISNPPYVTQGQKALMNANVIDYEPHIALFVPENDPLLFYRAISQFAQKTLKTNGNLYFEINEDLHNQSVSTVENAGFIGELKKDINGKYRMLKGIQHDKQ